MNTAKDEEVTTRTPKTRDAKRACPVEITLQVIGGRWKALILFHLQSEPRRFNELRRLIEGVTQRMLTAHLRELERDGLIVRTVLAVVPPHVTYSLSTIGQTLTPILAAMAVWGDAYQRPPSGEMAKGGV